LKVVLRRERFIGWQRLNMTVRLTAFINEVEARQTTD